MDQVCIKIEVNILRSQSKFVCLFVLISLNPAQVSKLTYLGCFIELEHIQCAHTFKKLIYLGTAALGNTR